MGFSDDKELGYINSMVGNAIAMANDPRDTYLERHFTK